MIKKWISSIHPQICRCLLGGIKIYGKIHPMEFSEQPNTSEIQFWMHWPDQIFANQLAFMSSSFPKIVLLLFLVQFGFFVRSRVFSHKMSAPLIRVRVPQTLSPRIQVARRQCYRIVTSTSLMYHKINLKINPPKIATAGSTRQWIIFHHPTYHIHQI